MKYATLLVIGLAACGTGTEPSTVVEEAATAAVELPPGDSLYASKNWGVVTGWDSTVYVVRSGRYCEVCDADVALYIHAPANGGLSLANGANARLQPGRITDGENGQVYHESRAFFGEVLPGVPGVIWYQHALANDGAMKDSTMLLDLTMGMEDSGQAGSTLMDKTLALLAEGKCSEILGVDRTTAP